MEETGAMITLLADFTSQNGQDLHDLLQAQGQNNWLMCVAVGVLLFIAFSNRFKT